MLNNVNISRLRFHQPRFYGRQRLTAESRSFFCFRFVIYVASENKPLSEAKNPWYSPRVSHHPSNRVPLEESYINPGRLNLISHRGNLSTMGMSNH